MVAIIDLEGYSMRKGPSVGFMKDGLNWMRLHYPYRLRSVYILNPGLVFSILWRLLQPMLSQKTKSKIFVLSNSEKSKLIENIGKDHLEEKYGGTLIPKPLKASDYFSKGYCDYVRTLFIIRR